MCGQFLCFTDRDNSTEGANYPFTHKQKLSWTQTLDCRWQTSPLPRPPHANTGTGWPARGEAPTLLPPTRSSDLVYPTVYGLSWSCRGTRPLPFCMQAYSHPSRPTFQPSLPQAPATTRQDGQGLAWDPTVPGVQMPLPFWSLHLHL